MSIENSSFLNDIAAPFRPYVQNIYQELELGLCKNKVDLERVSGCSEDSESQFRLVLPYCSKKLKWDIIFDISVPWFAPDFKFDDESFLNNVDVEFVVKNIPSLMKWDANDPRALTEVISELINLYKTYQIKKLSEDESSRAYFEYSALLGNALTTEQDIEVWVTGHLAEFLIKLKVDTSRLPELYNEGTAQNPGIDTALLLVRYPNSTNAELILSPFLTKVLGNITLPMMHQSGVLMDYVPMVTDLLNNKQGLAGVVKETMKPNSAPRMHVVRRPLCQEKGKQFKILPLPDDLIQSILNNDKLKRELLAQLIVKYEGAVLEHDANSAAFLFEMKDFHWILQIDILGVGYPENLPVLTLRSVYHNSKGKPKFKVLSGCPYHNFEAYIEQQVEIFKAECKGFPTNNQLVNLEV